MIGLGWRLLLLSLGGLGGYSIATFGLALPTVPAASPAAVTAAPETPAEGDPEELAASPPPMDCPPPPATRPPPPATVSVDDPPPETALPARYLPLVQGSLESPRTAGDWYRLFLAEPRDTAWADALEPEITNLLLQSGVQGLQSDYVRCATRRCTIAGYVDAGSEFDSCTIGDWLNRSAMVRRDLSLTCIEDEVAGLKRFIVFLDAEPAA